MSIIIKTCLECGADLEHIVLPPTHLFRRGDARNVDGSMSSG